MQSSLVSAGLCVGRKKELEREAVLRIGLDCSYACWFYGNKLSERWCEKYRDSGNWNGARERDTNRRTSAVPVSDCIVHLIGIPLN